MGALEAAIVFIEDATQIIQVGELALTAAQSAAGAIANLQKLKAGTFTDADRIASRAEEAALRANLQKPRLPPAA